MTTHLLKDEEKPNSLPIEEGWQVDQLNTPCLQPPPPRPPLASDLISRSCFHRWSSVYHAGERIRILAVTRLLLLFQMSPTPYAGKLDDSNVEFENMVGTISVYGLGAILAT